MCREFSIFSHFRSAGLGVAAVAHEKTNSAASAGPLIVKRYHFNIWNTILNHGRLFRMLSRARLAFSDVVTHSMFPMT